ncbi:single-stranded DNA-binding protein [Borrelia venezuelensis]|uniref:single-stranded DNA-binding protein n=1 Tax=Borrelia venezuelensis TaxID=1653839 RepID=UPI001FF443C6|nr:single-stranded DNA-binding protein [Borrelia venezuelensis]UPA12551.1 single-stranded DNA-binding protein [Borrelia venezuelensis]
MADINSLTLSGRLTRDSEIAYTSSNIGILKFSLANNIKVKQNGEWRGNAQFFDCILFGRRAESLLPLLIKGKQVVINGILRNDSFVNELTGVKRSRNVILVDQLKLFASLNSYGKVIEEEFHEDIPF